MIKEKGYDGRLWRLLSVAPNAETKVVNRLAERKLVGYAPIERVFVGRDRSRRAYDRPLIRSYVFAELAFEDQPEARDLAGVHQIIETSAERGSRALEAFVCQLREAETAGLYDHTRRKATQYVVGQEVIISKGQFRGIACSIAKLKPNRRVELVTSLFGSGRMTVKIEQIELLKAA